MKGGMFVMAWRAWVLYRCFYLLMELVLHDGAASDVVVAVVAVEAAVVAVAVHTVLEIVVAWTFAVDLDFDERFFAVEFVGAAHVVAAVLAAAAAAVGFDTAHAEHDVAEAADVEAVAVDNASPLLWACLHFAGAAA